MAAKKQKKRKQKKRNSPASVQRLFDLLMELHPGDDSDDFERFKTESTFVVFCSTHFHFVDELLNYLDAEHPTDIGDISDWVSEQIRDYFPIPKKGGIYSKVFKDKEKHD